MSNESVEVHKLYKIAASSVCFTGYSTFDTEEGFLHSLRSGARGGGRERSGPCAATQAMSKADKELKIWVPQLNRARRVTRNVISDERACELG